MSYNNPQVSQKSGQITRLFKARDLSSTIIQSNKKRSVQFNYAARIKNKTCSHFRQQNNNNLTFSPVIHQLPYQLYRKQNKSKLDKSRQLMRQRLIQDSTNVIRKRIEEKLKQKQQQLQLYTFKPVISDFSKYLNTSSTKDRSIHQRLFEEAEKIKSQRQAARKQKQSQQKAQIKNLLHYKLEYERKNILNSQKHNLKSIQDRIGQIMIQKARNRKQLQNKIRQQQNISFHPTINQESKDIYKKKQQRQNLKTNVIQRLMQEYEKSKKNKQQIINKFRQYQNEQCTFKPQINKYVNTQSRRQVNNRRDLCENDYCYTFTPQINQLSNLIVQQTRGRQSKQQQIFRLSQQPILDRKQNIKQLNDQIYGTMMFQPKINDISNQIRAHPRQHKCEIPQQQSFSFQPQINENSRMMRTSSLQIGKLKKKKKLIQYKYQSEYEQMKQCTFRPKINNKRHEDQRKLSQVQGTDRFLYQQQKSKEYIKQQKLRQENMFNLQIKYDQRRNKSSLKW